jgi:uncharacterized iron-regulated protein
MPSVSKKQERFMQAVAHNPKFAKAAGVPQSVGKEFTKSGGGMAKANPFMEMIAKKKAAAGKPMKKMAAGGATKMGAVKTAAPSRDGVAVKGKTKGAMPKMAGSKNMKSGGYC